MRRLFKSSTAVALAAAFAVGLAAIVPSLVRAADMTLDDAAVEITLLKRVVAEQDKRITALEQAVSAMRGGTVEAGYSRNPNAIKTGEASGAPWKASGNWDKIKQGMSESQVTAILGKPTKRDEVGNYKTLFYEGDVVGSGVVSGNVKFSDNQVYFGGVSKPVF